MRRLNFYDRQLVSVGDMSQLQLNIETLFKQLSANFFGQGVVSGLVVSPNTGMSVALASGVAIANSGTWCTLAAGLSKSLGTDYLGNTLAAVGAGKERWLSIQLGWAQESTDQVITPLNETVYYTLTDGVAIKVVAGVEASVGDAVKPSALSGHIILADVRMHESQTTVAPEDISTTRRQLCTNQPELLALIQNHTHPMEAITGLVAALAGKAALAHGHAMSDVTGLVTALAGKASLAHQHDMDDIQGLAAEFLSHHHGDDTLDGIDWSKVLNKPSAFPVEGHNHDLVYHKKTGDEVHTGGFQITKTPLAAQDPIRLGDFANLFKGEIKVQPGSTKASGYAFLGSGLVLAWVTGPSTWFSGSTNPIITLTTPVTFDTIYSYALSTENTEVAIGDNDAWWQMTQEFGGNKFKVICQCVGGNLGGWMAPVLWVLGSPVVHNVVVSNANLDLMAADGQTYPLLKTLQLGCTGSLGAVTWEITGTTGTGFTAEFVQGYTDRLQLSFPNTGTFTLSVKATDATGTIGTKTITINLNAYSATPINITTTSISKTTDSYPYTPVGVTLAYTGGVAPITWSIVAGANTTLPAAAFSAGKLTWTVEETGTWTVEVRAQDGAAQQDTQVITVEVETYIEDPDPICLDAEHTYILMADRSSKLLKDIKAGDRILTISDSGHERGTRALIPSMVEGVILREETHPEAPNAIFVHGMRATVLHPWAVMDFATNKGFWKHSIELTPDTVLIETDGRTLHSTLMGPVERDTKPVRLCGNLQVQHLTYLASANPNGPWLLSHNINDEPSWWW